MSNNKQANGKLDNFYQSQKLPMSVRAIQLYFKRIGWMFPRQSAKLFWKLFTTPRNRKIKDWQQDFLDSAAVADTFIIDGLEYKTYSWGNGPKTVLMLHGWEGMTVDFKKMIDALLEEGEYRIISFDFPGHGTAEGSHSSLVAFMKGTKQILRKLKTVHAVIGHSLGASASFFSLAELNKEVKTEHLVMLGSYPIPFHFFRTFQNFMEIPQPLFEKCVDYAEDLVNMNIRGYNMYEMRYNIPAQSVLMIHDIHDEVADIEKAKALAAEWEGTDILVGDHGGHFKHFRHPEVVQRVVEQLKQHESAALSLH